MPSIPDPRAIGAIPNVMIATLILVVLAIFKSYRRPRTTRFRGPPRKSFFFGVAKDIFDTVDLSGMYRNWENTYGLVYEIPFPLGSRILVLQDPKAVADLLLKDATIYHQNGATKALFRNILMVS